MRADILRLAEQTPLTVTDAAEALSVSTKTVNRLIAAGKLGSIKIESSRRVRVGDCLAYLAGLEQPREQPLLQTGPDWAGQAGTPSKIAPITRRKYRTGGA